MQVRFGKCTYTMDSGELGRLKPSNDILHNAKALQKRLDIDGYLYLKDYLDRDAVLMARRTTLQFMAEHEAMEPGSRPLDGVMGTYGRSVQLLGRRAITHAPAVNAVLNSPRLFDLYQRLFGESAMTFSYKWLRAVGNEQCTGCHMDHVYMGRGSDRLMTCWIPFGDIPIEQGTLVLCERSHNDPAFEKLHNTYGRMDVDRDLVDGWFTDTPREITKTFGGRWLTDDVQAGDIITFGMHLMHASTTNTTDRWRLSCDARFQPQSDPADERWIGEDPLGHYKWLKPQQNLKPIEIARAEWGV